MACRGRYLLEMKDKIHLSAEQVAKISSVYENMKAQAISLGHELIRLESDLEMRFRNRSITKSKLRLSLEAIERVRHKLRYTHLAAHLKTPSILSDTQIASYNRLRGYTDGDACRQIPAGHDPAVWRQHNGCD